MTVPFQVEDLPGGKTSPQLDDQPGLADARLADDGHHLTLARIAAAKRPFSRSSSSSRPTNRGVDRLAVSPRSMPPSRNAERRPLRRRAA